MLEIKYWVHNFNIHAAPHRIITTKWWKILWFLLLLYWFHFIASWARGCPHRDVTLGTNWGIPLYSCSFFVFFFFFNNYFIIFKFWLFLIFIVKPRQVCTESLTLLRPWYWSITMWFCHVSQIPLLRWSPMVSIFLSHRPHLRVVLSDLEYSLFLLLPFILAIFYLSYAICYIKKKIKLKIETGFRFQSRMHANHCWFWWIVLFKLSCFLILNK